MHFFDLELSDFEAFRRNLRKLVPASDEDFNNNVFYDQEYIEIEEYNLFNYVVDNTKALEITYLLSCMFDCICLVEYYIEIENKVRGDYLRIENGVIISLSDRDIGETAQWFDARENFQMIDFNSEEKKVVNEPW